MVWRACGPRERWRGWCCGRCCCCGCRRRRRRRRGGHGVFFWRAEWGGGDVETRWLVRQCQCRCRRRHPTRPHHQQHTLFSTCPRAPTHNTHTHTHARAPVRPSPTKTPHPLPNTRRASANCRLDSCVQYRILPANPAPCQLYCRQPCVPNQHHRRDSAPTAPHGLCDLAGPGHAQAAHGQIHAQGRQRSAHLDRRYAGRAAACRRPARCPQGWDRIMQVSGRHQSNRLAGSE